MSPLHRFSTLLTLALDVHTHRQTVHRGLYNPMADTKPIAFQARAQSPPNNHSYSDPHAPEYHDTPYTSHDVPLEVPEYTHEGKGSYKAQKPIEANQFGYAAPTEQTRYDGAGDLGLSWRGGA